MKSPKINNSKGGHVIVEKVRYMISDAAALAGVETHVLRYWEEELDLTIPRNEMGHRYYTRENIQEFQKIKELKEKGFYFLFYNPKGTMPNDVWDIIPEDSQHRKMHFAPYPEELCVIPIKSTCPKDGVVLDPFSGTGTTMKVAYDLGRKSIGIDLSNEYIKLAEQRICQESGSYLLFQ